MNIWLILAAIGTLVIFALAVYAGKLLMQVKHQKEQQLLAKEKQTYDLQKHDNKIYQSVTLIVKAMQEKQCDYSEGCWRLSVLLDSLKLTPSLSGEFPAIFELYAGIKHLAIKDERKQLTKQQRMKQDVERMKLEAALTDKIDQELAQLFQRVEESKYQLNH